MFLEQFTKENGQQGWIEVICGSMFSGKTEELLRRLRRAEFAKQSILLFKPIIDDRYATEAVVSHQGQSWVAKRVAAAIEIQNSWQGEQIVAIDEAQFFDHEIIDEWRNDDDHFAPDDSLSWYPHYKTGIWIIFHILDESYVESLDLLEGQEQIVVDKITRYNEPLPTPPNYTFLEEELAFYNKHDLDVKHYEMESFIGNTVSLNLNFK
jgi:hypothetical protein